MKPGIIPNSTREKSEHFNALNDFHTLAEKQRTNHSI